MFSYFFFFFFHQHRINGSLKKKRSQGSERAMEDFVTNSVSKGIEKIEVILLKKNRKREIQDKIHCPKEKKKKEKRNLLIFINKSLEQSMDLERIYL